MNEWLLKHLIKNAETTDPRVRYRYGKVACLIGILANFLLFCLKAAVGFSVNAVAIVSDAFNNLSDCLAGAVTLVGIRIASAPSDKAHPFGHGRMEYIISLGISFIIFLNAWELLKESILRIISVQAVSFSLTGFILVGLSVPVKLWLWRFYGHVAGRIDSSALAASAKDALQDIFTTAAALCGVVGTILFPSFPLDGIAGVFVSLVIALTGYGIARDVGDKLLGTPGEATTAQKIKDIILAYPEAKGIHDMIIHEYGTGNLFASAHVEVDSRMDFLKAHDVIDNAERKIRKELGVQMTLHLDPTDYDNPLVKQYRALTEEILSGIDASLSLHDFRVVEGETHINLIFDVLIPYACKKREEDITEGLEEAYKNHLPRIYTVITFDRDYLGETDGEKKNESAFKDLLKKRHDA